MEPRSNKSQVRIERILEAAQEVFSHKGYNEASVDEIAAASQTSKGGVYFYFPNKQTIFLNLLDRVADMLLSRARQAMAAEPDPLCKGDAALLTMLRTFAGHRRLARLFLVEALGAGREFNLKILEIHTAFAALIADHLDDLVRTGLIAPLDTRLAGLAWFGGVNEVVRRWILTGEPADLETTYPALRDLLRRSIGQK